MQAIELKTDELTTLATTGRAVVRRQLSINWVRGKSEGKSCWKTPWATVWDHGYWWTWDKHGVGGENGVDDTFGVAQAEAIQAAARQGFLPCPLGAPGEQRWVREVWASKCGEICEEHKACLRYRVGYDYLGGNMRWQSVRSMPQWASRFTVTIESVTVERDGDGVWWWVVSLAAPGEGEK